MKTHTTNYINTFIEIAEDCPVGAGVAPPEKNGRKTVANLQFDMLADHPYEFTSDDIMFAVFAQKKELPEGEWEEQRKLFFSKGQPCFRASPLPKQYGWGVHHDEKGRIAMYGVETTEYQRYLRDDSVKKIKAMRNKRA